MIKLWDNEENDWWRYSDSKSPMTFSGVNDPYFSCYAESVASGRFSVVED